MYTIVVGRDEAPKIGGSSTGFIVLIVCLILVFILSTAAIVYLLSDARSTGNFTRYSQRRRRYEQRSMGAYDTSTKPSTWSWAKRLIPFSHLRNAPVDSPAATLSSSMPVQDGRGWYQTGSGDSWDYTAPQIAEVQRSHAEPYSYPTSAHTLSPPPTVDFHEHRVASPLSRLKDNSSMASNVHFGAPDSREPPGSSSHLDSYPTLLSSRVFFSSPSPSPTSTPVRAGSTSPRPISMDLSRRSPTPHRTGSADAETIQSASLPKRTFEGGSKFLEAL